MALYFTNYSGKLISAIRNGMICVYRDGKGKLGIIASLLFCTSPSQKENPDLPPLVGVFAFWRWLVLFGFISGGTQGAEHPGRV